jgi:hypothetical protein
MPSRSTIACSATQTEVRASALPPSHRQALQSPHDQPGCPVELIDLDGKRQTPVSLRQLDQRDLAFRAGQRFADAVVDTMPEARVMIR